MTSDGLSRRWMAACRGAGGADPDQRRAGAVWEEVRTRYAEPQRHYHTLIHVADVVAVMDRLIAASPPPLTPQEHDACLLAAVLHDVVYDPQAPGNEAASAHLARRWLGDLGVDRSVVELAARLIESTADHDAAAGDRPAAILADADLSILGQPPERYRQYREAVRREYAHVPDDAWRAGRGTLLDSLLARPRLFVTDAGARWFEARARQNLAGERADLAG